MAAMGSAPCHAECLVTLLSEPQHSFRNFPLEETIQEAAAESRLPNCLRKVKLA